MKTSIILPFLFLAVFSNCQKSESKGNAEPLRTYDEIVSATEREGIPLSKIGLKRNWNEVLAIASMYGLQDTFRNQERTNTSMMFDTEDNLHAYFKQTKKVFESRRQYKVYMEMGQHVQCLSDYFSLLDSLPLYRIQRYSDEEYAAMKKKYFASNYVFYINETVSGPNNRIPPFLIVVTKPEEMPREKARRIAKR